MQKAGWMLAGALCLLLLGGCEGRFSSTVGAQGNFNNASLQGGYAFRITGFEGNGRYLVSVGRLTLDGAGSITSGTEDRAETGLPILFPQPVGGSYHVNSDGTGSITISFNGAAEPFDIAIASGGQIVKLALTEPNALINPAVSGEMQKQ